MGGNTGNGFDKHPENINTKGRPPKEHSLTDLLREALEQPRDETGKATKQLIIDKIIELGLEGESENMLKYVFDRSDGKPKEKVEHSGEIVTAQKFTVEGNESD